VRAANALEHNRIPPPIRAEVTFLLTLLMVPTRFSLTRADPAAETTRRGLCAAPPSEKRYALSCVIWKRKGRALYRRQRAAPEYADVTGAKATP
jgi:hypothetical protein